MLGPWVANQEPDLYASLRLICLPYAGGSASIYRSWQDAAPDHIQVCPVELPGRGIRAREAPFTRLAPLVRQLADALDEFLDRPFAIFGHSMGGIVAFELARALRRQGGPQADHLFISAANAPGSPRTRPMIHNASVEDLKKELRALNGTPQLLLEDEELMSLVLPSLRADMSVIETYEYRAEPPLELPVTVFGGTADMIVPPSELAGWRNQSSQEFRLQLFPGDHFFLHGAARSLLGAIADALTPTATPSR